jgi:type I restriction enzyme S subunit
VVCIDEEIPFEIASGWEWCRFSSIYWQLTDGTHSTPKYTQSGIPFLSVKDMSTGRLSFANTKFISEEEHKLLSQRCHPCKGDLLLSKVGTTGIPLIIDDDREFSIFVSLALIKFFPKFVYSSFLIALLNSPLVQMQVKENTRGVGNKNWVLTAISNTLLAIPPLREQQRIVEKIDILSPYTDRYAHSESKISHLNKEIGSSLKKSILHEAIQGKLVPQDASDEPASVLLQRIREEKLRLVAEGKLKKKDVIDSTIFRGDDNKYFEKKGKDSVCIDDEVPFEIPDAWVWTRLSCVAEIYTGNSISETEKRLKFTKVAGRYYIGTKDVDFDNNVMYDNGIAIPKQYEDKFRIAPNHSILMCIEGGSAGRKIAIINKDVCFGNKLCCFSPFVDMGKFIYYYLQSPSFIDMFNDNKTGIIGGVSIAKVKEILIPLPPQREMNRIVAKIDEFVASIMSK